MKIEDNPVRDMNNARNLPRGIDPILELINERNRAERERDEARHEIEGWRNKWQCAVEMAARAEVERDEALRQSSKFCDIAERAINYMDPRYVYREEIRPELGELKKATP